jgi:hypothetical protein
VILLLIGGIVLPFVGWVVGVVLLWASSRWRISDKVLGTLVWPGGLGALLAVLLLAAVPTQECSAYGNGTRFHSSCSGPALPTWLGITIFVVLLLAAIVRPILVAIRLLLRARGETISPGSAEDMTYLAT